MKNQGAATTVLLVAGLLILLTACEESETIPPEGSTITLAANPATLVLGLGGEAGRADIVATVRSELGVPLPGQDVRFSSTAGQLTLPGTSQTAANIPIETDSLGNATVELISDTSTTVTATSGNTSESLTLTTTTANVSTILLNVDTDSPDCPVASSTIVDSCSDEICLEATAQQSDGTPIDGVVISFELRNNTADGTFNDFFGTFIPDQETTGPSSGNPTGVAFTRFEVDTSSCVATDTGCKASTNGGPCKGQIVAVSGTVESRALDLTIGIP